MLNKGEGPVTPYDPLEGPPPEDMAAFHIRLGLTTCHK
jgi:hypothetical protein